MAKIATIVGRLSFVFSVALLPYSAGATEPNWGEGVSSAIPLAIDAHPSKADVKAFWRIIHISSYALAEQKPSGGQILYRVHASVDTATTHSRVGQNIKIQPGITATAEILTGSTPY